MSAEGTCAQVEHKFDLYSRFTYIVEELTGIKGAKGSLLGTVLTAGIPVFFIFQTMADASGNIIPAWRLFWDTFGASNQLLAALALIGVSIWLKE